VTFNYEGLHQTATDLIKRFGTDMTLREMTAAGTFDPTLTPQDQPCVGVVSRFSAREIDGVRVLRSDRKVFLSAESAVPTIKHRLKTDDGVYQILEVVTMKPATVALVYVLQVRK
jgi:hypothetical protein